MASFPFIRQDGRLAPGISLSKRSFQLTTEVII
jgi:hypothetical protein